MGFIDIYHKKIKINKNTHFGDFWLARGKKLWNDHFLVSNNLIENVKSVINKKPRGQIKPSDHTPN